VRVLVAQVEGALMADAAAARQVQVAQLPHIPQRPVPLGEVCVSLG
jgi:hypothetical protein